MNGLAAQGRAAKGGGGRDADGFGRERNGWRYGVKKVLAWLKVNWPIVLCSLVILSALPAGIIIGGSFQQKLVDDVKNTVDADFKELNNDKMTYDIPAPIPGQPKFDFSGQPPNAKIIDEFSAKRKELAGQLGSVAGQAVEFNRGDHVPLIEGFFPDPPTAAYQKRAEFTKAFLALGDKLVAMVKGGSPPDQKVLLENLKTYVKQQLTKASTEMGVSDKDVPAARKLQIRGELIKLRADAYRAGAQNIQLYIERPEIAAIPVRPPDRDFDMRQAWDSQEQAWMLQDLFKAIRSVNEKAQNDPDATRFGRGVPASVVKRIMHIEIDPHPFFGLVNQASDSEDPLAPKDTAPAGPIVVQIDQRRVSGRASGPSIKNNAFDVRKLNCNLVVSTERLPRLLDELVATNFITAIVANVSQVDVRNQLDLGYYYGDEHVVKVDLRLEWCWLREWTGPLMPADVKKMVGYKEPAPAGEEGVRKPRREAPAGETPAKPTEAPKGNG
jgi:hypothetical protein